MFDKLKEQTLNKLNEADKSKKGSVDEPIKEIIDFINQQKNFYTTSSCSGRIIVIEIGAKKNEAKWLYVTHETGDTKKVIESLNNLKTDVWIKLEPAIFHVVSRTLDDCKIILDAARNAGMKRTGITTLGEKLLVQVSSTDQVSTILAKNGEKIVTDQYLKEIIEACNKKMQKNQERLRLFITELRQRIS